MKPLRDEREPSRAAEWPALLPSYERLIVDASRDSKYLRKVGLQRNLADLLGDCSTARLLDIGSGNGWLLDSIRPREGFECDCVAPSTARPGRHFSLEDVRSLSYASGAFDVVVASMVLMWVEDLDRACKEIYRVTAPGGRAIIAIVHPFSYRTGTVTEHGEFLITKRYSEPFELPNLFIADAVGPFRFFHRPLASYLNAFCNAGYRLEKTLEWSIDLKEYGQHVPPGVTHPARTDRVPMYAFFVLRKDA